MKEVVGNLVITDIQKYLDKVYNPSSIGGALANAINNLSKTVQYDFNRVRQSVVDAYEGKYYSIDFRSIIFGFFFQLLLLEKIQN
jgi:hypothetical protein